ncbi:MAG: hypothetical protein AVDCRST_MAG78-858, partial [uncultured Rubrobacteraceae bacterium]
GGCRRRCLPRRGLGCAVRGPRARIRPSPGRGPLSPERTLRAFASPDRRKAPWPPPRFGPGSRPLRRPVSWAKCVPVSKAPPRRP